MANTLKNNKWLWIIFVVFIFTRFLGLGQIYHQDEYRWASIANPVFGDLASPHPPLPEYLYKISGRILGFDYLRIVPLVFGFLNLVLIYFISIKITKNKKIALIAAGLFMINVYSLIANLQIDIDGAILPFFILLSYYAYLHILEDGKSKKWLILFCLAVGGGFLTKLSFLLFIAALFVDQGLRVYYSRQRNIKQIFSGLWPWVTGFLVLGVLLYYFYASNFGKIIEYAKHFNSLNFSSRAYFDLGFKLLKSLVWLSPLLFLPVLYGLFRKEVFQKYLIWFVYLGLNLIFYLILFDFARLTIERYFMFFIVPSVIIGSHIIYEFLHDFRWKTNYLFIISISVFFIAVSLFILSLPHSVLPLNPKIEYLNHLKSFDLKFLIPFTGGSGPVGFYHSAGFVFWMWVSAVILFTFSLAVKNHRHYFMLAFVIAGLIYNLFMSVEYLFGVAFGSVPNVARRTIDYVVENRNIDRVITYYDTGAYYLKQSGQYSSRFYTAPLRDYREKLSQFDGYYMIVDFPAIDKSGRYWPYLQRCKNVKKFSDKKVEAYILDCQGI